MQQAMIRDTYANGASEKEFQVLMEIAKLRKLNPLLKQIHFVKRWNKQLGREVWSAQVSIDGLRAIAERTGKYDGQDEPEYEHDKEGLLTCAKVKVYRKDWTRPAVGVAYWNEYVQTGKDDKPTKFWADMPHVMLAKVAEALAMRKAFPEDMGGLYTDEEMQQADSDRPQLANPRSMHSLPGEDPDSPDKPNEEFESIMETLRSADKAVFDTFCDYNTMCSWRAVVGSRSNPTELCKRMSELARGDGIGPGQRQELGKLWNRVDRKLTQLEGKLKPPSVEDSFSDPPDEDDGTDAFSPGKEQLT